ncbi:hypothetical protein Tco_0285420 [Tanacetum coccineum]
MEESVARRHDVKQEVDRNEDMIRSALQAISSLNRISQWVNFLVFKRMVWENEMHEYGAGKRDARIWWLIGLPSRNSRKKSAWIRNASGDVGKTLAEIEKLHLFVINNTAIIFANSALHITVITQMDKRLNHDNEGFSKESVLWSKAILSTVAFGSFCKRIYNS